MSGTLKERLLHFSEEAMLVADDANRAMVHRDHIAQSARELAEGLAVVANNLPPEGGATPTNRGGGKTAESDLEAARMEAVRAWGGQNYVEEKDLHVDPATLEALTLFGLLNHATVRHRLNEKPVRVFCLTSEHRRLWSGVCALRAVEMMGGDRG